MRCTCPNSAGLLFQDRNPDGLNYCTNCHKLFLIPPEEPVPTWILGVVAFLLLNLQVYWHLSLQH